MKGAKYYYYYSPNEISGNKPDNDHDLNKKSKNIRSNESQKPIVTTKCNIRHKTEQTVLNSKKNYIIFIVCLIQQKKIYIQV